MIDEDEVVLKEKPEDTRYIKKITSKWKPKHWECEQTKYLIPSFARVMSGRQRIIYNGRPQLFSFLRHYDIPFSVLKEIITQSRNR